MDVSSGSSEQATEAPSSAVVDIPACGGSIALTETELYCDLSGGVVINPGVVAPLKSIRKVSFETNPGDIGFLAALPSVEDVSFDEGVAAELGPLLALPSLRRLAILGPAPRIDTIEGLSTLTHLDLTHAELSDLRYLTGNTELVELRMLWTDVPDISPIAAFGKLERLQLQAPSPPNQEGSVVDPDWRRRKDSLGFLVRLERLEEASFHSLLLEDGCRGLEHASSLQALVLENSGPCEGFDVLSGLQNLERAELSRSKFVDPSLTRLTSVPALVSISLTGTGVGDLESLASLPSLRFLHFVPKTARQRRSLDKLRHEKPDLEVSR